MVSYSGQNLQGQAALAIPISCFVYNITLLKNPEPQSQRRISIDSQRNHDAIARLFDRNVRRP